MDGDLICKRRVVRVFISSTFRDMQVERDELAKVVFPELRRFCQARRVAFIEVDLRWGVTEEQTQRGETLRLCLEEINRCRPYFIGLLGERYGWLPGLLQPEDALDYPWIVDLTGCSLTELEIRHGVLNNPSMTGRARFYFRLPAYIRTLVPELQNNFASENPQSAQKLAALKERIRTAGMPVVEDYPDPQNAARRIGEDLRQMIEAEFPAEHKTDPLDRETADQAPYILNRLQVYVGRPEYFEALDDFAAQAGSDAVSGGPLVVLGDSGAGKTALLANWAVHYQLQRPQDFLLAHYIGSTPASTDYSALLQRLMAELKRRFNLPETIPEKPADLVNLFPRWLAQAAAVTQPQQDHRVTVKHGLFGRLKRLFGKPSPSKSPRPPRIVLVLDGLNQLEDRDHSLELGWLPESFPPWVRVIVSSLPGPSLAELQRRPHTDLHVQPLTVTERERLVVDYLAGYSRKLDPSSLIKISEAGPCANPLYLQVLLEELRLFGLYEKLAERIADYLQAQTVDEMYQKMLERMAVDYDPARRGVWTPPAEHSGNMVDEALSLIWAARRGLTENELLDLLGNPPRAAWSPLYLALGESLVERGGVLNFFHDYLRQAVETRCLTSAERQLALRRRLVEYFSGLLRSEGPATSSKALPGRVLEELPWLLRMTNDWPSLFDLLANTQVFNALWQLAPFEVRTLWAAVEANSALTKVTAYWPVLNNPAAYADVTLWGLATLFGDTGCLDESLTLMTYLSQHYQQNSDQENFATSLGNQALILQDRGDLDAAMALLKEQEQICLKTGKTDGLMSSLNNQATILFERGDLDGAMSLYKKQEQISRKNNRLDNLSSCLGNQALILWDRGDLDGATVLLKEQEKICRQLGKVDGLKTSLGNQANILFIQGNLDQSLVLHQEEERLCRELGNQDGLQTCLGGQALILKTRGDLAGAMSLFKEQEMICRQLGKLDGLQSSLHNQANILFARGDLDQALRFHQEEERICRQMGNQNGIAASLSGQALILKTRGDIKKAMALQKDLEQIYQKTGNLDGLQGTFGDQGVILQLRGDLDKAMALHKQKEAICRQLGKLDDLSVSLGNQANIHHSRGDLAGATILYQEQERLCRQLGLLDGLQRSLGNQAVILKDQNNLERALALHQEQEGICRQLDLKDDLAASLGNQANIYQAWGDPDRAMALHREEEQLCRQLGSLEGLQYSLGNQANILHDRGDLKGAMTLFKEKEHLCRQLGNMGSLQNCLGNQGLVLKDQGDLSGAMQLLKEQERLCRLLGRKDGLATSQVNQAVIMNMRGDRKGAQKLAGEALELARKNGYTNLAIKIEKIIHGLASE